MEQIYNEFTTKVLPKVQEGLMISKDYFIDLYGRYIKYLIIQDSLLIGLGLLFLIVSAVSGYLLYKFYKNEERGYYDDPVHLFMICGISLVIGFILTIVSTSNLIKDFYIPEVRILEIINRK